MASSAEETAADWVEYLNRLLWLDKAWVSALFLARKPCNRFIATHPHLPVDNRGSQGDLGGVPRYQRDLEDLPDPEWVAGFLGLLNGFLGPGLGGVPRIAALLDSESGELERFVLTSELVPDEEVDEAPGEG